MDFNKKENRQVVGAKLKNIFDHMITEIVGMVGEENFSYMDMKKISETMCSNVPDKVGLKHLPQQVKIALEVAISVMDPNKNRKEKNLKNILSLGTGATGATVATASVLTKAGAIATLKAAVFGGLAIGTLPIAGAIGGISLIAAAIYIHKSEMTPKEKIVKCIDAVNAGVNDWIENGCNEN